ncbi:hypothetical protein Misp03_73480 [Microbispora sp. NBRC 16548]|nr:hypothetical protein Misp03_73480 [Microbispora sp. NBRC 16548]
MRPGRRHMVLLGVGSDYEENLTTHHYTELIFRWRPGAGSVSIVPSPGIPARSGQTRAAVTATVT